MAELKKDAYKMKKGKKTLPWQRFKTNEFDGRVFLLAQIKTKLSACLRNYKTKNDINNEEKMKAININTDKSLSIIEVDIETLLRRIS